MGILVSMTARLWMTLAGVALAAAACGSGSVALHSNSAPQAVTGGQDSGSQGGTTAPAPQAPGQAGAAHAQGAQPAPATVAGPATGVTSTGSKSMGLPQPPGGLPRPGGVAPPGAVQKNFASDVGVTATTINIGIINIASANRSLGPPIALASQRMTDAMVHYINDNGGVAGRTLNLLTCDDGGDVTRARACYEKLKHEVFAFVPSETWLTDTIHDTLANDRIPWFSWGWFASEYHDPYMFPCHANGMREASNVAKWVALNRHPKSVGIMYLNVTEDINAENVASRVLQQYGIPVVQKVAQEWDSPDESQHVLAMRVANPDAILSFSWPTPVAKFMHDAQGQNWAPKMGYFANHLTGDPGYGPIFGDYIKNTTITITSWITPAQGQTDAENNLPGLKLWEMLSKRFTGMDLVGFHFKYTFGHHITQSALYCTQVFADVARTLGPDLTRARFIQALEAGSFNSGAGIVLRWPHGDHGKEPYSFNHEYLYKWIPGNAGCPAGQPCPDGYDLMRVRPDPIDV